METTNELLNAVKQRHGVPSDYALAARLEVTRAQVSKYRTRGEKLGDEAALKVAELLDLPPGYVLACAAFERAKSDVSRSAWQDAARVLKRFGTAAAIALVVAVPVHQQIDKNDTSQALAYSVVPTMYIMSNLARAFFRRSPMRFLHSFAGFFRALGERHNAGFLPCPGN